MPVTITIGETFLNEDYQPPARDVERDNDPDAPLFPNDDTLEPASNWRYVNAPAWRACAIECGLQAWMDALLASDQSNRVRSLTAEDYRVVNEAYLLRSAFREGKPGWDAELSEEDREKIGELTGKPGHDACLARLAWLRFWIRWALENCAQPAVVVSW